VYTFFTTFFFGQKIAKWQKEIGVATNVVIF
jgi:hypothetical protein